jgi:hypothetical protein
MIIQNGYILFRLSADGGLDSAGYPTSTAERWSERIACQYLPGNNLRARSNGEAYTAQSYTVYVERMDIPSEVVKLCSEHGEIGQFSIRSYEHLDAVCQTKIVL